MYVPTLHSTTEEQFRPVMGCYVSVSTCLAICQYAPVR